MSSIIHIPQPCHENWDAMTPVAQGRHCTQCCKTVIDFTGWEVEAIADYLNTNAASSPCGRFTAGQLEQNYFAPETYLHHVFTSGLHYLKQIAAIVLFVFVLSSTAGAQSRPQQLPATAPQRPLAGAPVAIPNHNKPDTTKLPMIKGRVVPARHPMGKPAIHQPPK